MDTEHFEYEPIENVENWARDPRTGLLCNTDFEAIEEYKRYRESLEQASIRRGDRVRQERQKHQILENEVNSLKDDVSEIKSLLKDLVQGLSKDV